MTKKLRTGRRKEIECRAGERVFVETDSRKGPDCGWTLF